MWITALDGEHWLQKQLYSAVMTAAADIKRVADINGFVKRLCDCENIDHTSVLNVDLGSGSACVSAEVDRKLFYDVLKESTGIEISNEQQLMKEIIEFSAIKREYYRFKNALDEVEATGYGIVMPEINELTLQEPEIVKAGRQIRRKAACIGTVDTHDESQYHHRGLADSRFGKAERGSCHVSARRIQGRIRQRSGTPTFSENRCMSL